MTIENHTELLNKILNGNVLKLETIIKTCNCTDEYVILIGFLTIVTSIISFIVVLD
jgi:hypothetical protein